MRPLLIFIAAVASAATPAERALAYLSAEVPKWRSENGCFSCHNNGDGARALYAARKAGRQVQPSVLGQTNDWLSAPDTWEDGRSDGPNSDKRLARMQFAAALAAAVESGAIADRQPLLRAAESLLPLQSQDGAWEIEDEGEAAGSPVTWGTALATYSVRATLQSADAKRFALAIEKAGQWLRTLTPRYTPDAAAVLLAFPAEKQLVERFTRTQTSDGGWGPVPKAPAEPFDTALVLLALTRADGDNTAVARGREFLIKLQLPSGGWPETTRPAGSQSYAQHISTTAWATMALLATDRQ